MSESRVFDVNHSRLVTSTEQLELYRQDLLSYGQQLKLSEADAEDMAQTALLKALPILQGQQSHPNLPALLRRIAKNAWIDNVRKQANWLLVRDVQASVTAEAKPIDQRLLIEDALVTLIRRLTPNQRLVFLLCDTLQYSLAEAADIIGTSQGAAKALLHRARICLARSWPVEMESAEMTEADPQRDILRAYSAAFHSADVAALLQLCQSGSIDANYATRKVMAMADHRMQTQRRATDVMNGQYAA